MKKERYLEHSTTTQRERSRDERNYEVGDSSRGFLVGPNQGTFSMPVEGRINIERERERERERESACARARGRIATDQ